MASYYVQKHKRETWSLYEQSYKDKKSYQIRVDRLAYKALGFNPGWTVAEARKRCAEINGGNSAKRAEQRSIVRAAKRVAYKLHSLSQWLPTDEVEEFTFFLRKTNMGSEQHLEKRMIMWETAKKIIAEVNVSPRDYSDYTKSWFNVFISRQYSVDYSNKLVALINQWGQFYSKKRNANFDPIRYPTAQERGKILMAYRKSVRCRENGSDRLTPELLYKYVNKLKPEVYRWLHVSLWLGLRPDEIELAEYTKYTHNIYNIPIIRIYQPKVGQWKHIPLLYPEQKEAVEWLLPSRRPLNRTIQGVFGNKRITCYSGRKGFEQLMRNLGENLVDISSWLGHTSLRTTRKHYENLDKVTISRKVG